MCTKNEDNNTFHAQSFFYLQLFHQQIHLDQDVTFPCRAKSAHVDSCIDVETVLPFVSTGLTLVATMASLPNK